MYDVKGMRSGSLGALAVGALLVLAGMLVVSSGGEAVFVGIILIGVGWVMVLSSLRGLVRRAPQVRATEAGISFAGGAVIPWTAIKQIYVGSFDVRASFIHGRTASIAFDFHKRRTMFRLPMSMWMTSPLAVGDVDISPAATADRPSVIAAKLEAMRVRAVGTEDGITVGESELPAARVVEHDR